ncbi:TonB-linked SusC/RagA family outer membrane protein [Mucilaginibacter oryzae]|uniref:TonB-linked SusC/RagA family outer membrane protein n=1 Tax=Mucilaginibacter oryzae TaxID=468058 RepID=A0A316HFU5_9SPHI|nr:TonB-dependent receptor [Mucilaginibacter oryzae]PWK77105.1 TonB-linked SusC/RagA family outer membrane protein [Mucilaginibacter oryzae]
MKNIVPGQRVLKFIHFMKISTLVLALLWCLCFTIIAGDADSQEVLKKHLTISFKNERLSRALENITKVTGVKFTYNGSVANSTVKVSAAVNNQPLNLLLDKLLMSTPYNYQELDDEIFIYFDKKKPALKPQSRVLTGFVYNDHDEPLTGATVKIMATGKGVVTNAQGSYVVDIEHDEDILIFSYVGFKTRQEKAGTNRTLNIKLEADTQQSRLNEVAVVAYGTQRKISLTGAQSTANVDDLKQPVADFTSLLTGRVSGIVGLQLSGEPGKDVSTIYIRGLSSFVSSGDITPLTMIDGVERSIDMVSVDDIQSITILKDASATAVYGVNGANGVILVQTKRGRPGNNRISADYYEGLSKFTRTPKMADGLTYMAAVNEALTTRGQAPKYTESYIAHTRSGTDPLLYPNVNWLDVLFNKTSSNRKANVNINGGSSGLAYYISTSYLNQTGLLKNDEHTGYNSAIDYKRYNFVGNFDLQAAKSTRISLSINGYVTNGNYPSQTPAAIFGYAMTIPPTEFPPEYPGGFVPGRTANGSEPNPYGQLTQSGFGVENHSQVNTQLRLTQQLGGLAKGLNFSAMYAYDINSSSVINRYRDPDTWQPDQQNPYNADGTLNLVKTSTGTGSLLSFDSVNSGYRNSYAEASLNYDNSFGKNRFGGLLLFNQRSAGVYPVTSYADYIPHRQRGLAGRVTYSRSDRYFAEVNLGYNGSNNFAPGNRYGFFPAYGIGWMLSEEKFFSGLKKAVPMLKLRYSDGHVGSDDIAGPRFAYLTILREGSAGYTFGLNRNSLTGIAVNSYGTNTSWSNSHKQDLGFDIDVMGKVNLSADFFKEYRDKVIMQRSSIPLFIGLTTQPFANLGAMSNKGFDATLSGRFNLAGLALQIDGTVSYNKAKIVDNDEQPPPYPWMDKRGHSPIATYGYIAEGLFTSQNEIDNSAVPGDKTTVKPGDIKYRDLNHDGKINAYDVTAITEGDLSPLTFGAGFGATFRNFFMNTFFVGTKNARRYLGGTAIQPFSTNGGISNAFANITDRWTELNPSQNVFYPRLAYGNAANANNSAVSSWWVKDIGFIRLKTFNFGYNLPKLLLSKLGLKNAAVYLEGYNLLTFSSFKLWDPEEGTINGTQYPNVKTVALGLKAVFN